MDIFPNPNLLPLFTVHINSHLYNSYLFLVSFWLAISNYFPAAESQTGELKLAILRWELKL
ncbi:hypothetical protein L1049_024857 [Liquidambar formosana]|uniref:Uncharacterized protein n=1 Tax=Liquidambar formosana TaxID=63359 RepID=A0AAP0RWE0_LIQFO